MLAVASLLLVYSSIVTLAYKHHGGNTFYYLFRHGFFLGVGFLLMYVVHKVKYKYFSPISQVLVGVSIPLLLLTLVMGANVNNATRWLQIPIINQSFQTSDLAKLGIIILVARLLSQRQDQIKSYGKTFLPTLLWVGVVCTLILPANFSTAAVLFFCCVTLMFIGGIPIKNLITLIPAGIIVVVIGWAVATVAPNALPRAATWKARVERYIDGERDRDGDYQVEQAKIAIATGGVTGKGPGNSTQRNFLPAPYSDFIYAIVLEEYGMFGGLGILFLYLMLLYRCVRIASKTNNTFAALLVIGIGFMMVFQALINMGVAVNVLPVTGQPLPLVSMGGTSIWFTCIGLGIILSVSRGVDEENNESSKVPDYAVA